MARGTVFHLNGGFPTRARHGRWLRLSLLPITADEEQWSQQPPPSIIASPYRYRGLGEHMT